MTDRPLSRRKFLGKQPWSKEELQTLRNIYSTAPFEDLKRAFPNRNINSLKGKAGTLGISRVKQTIRTSDRITRQKTQWAKLDRMRYPEKYRVRSAINYQNNREKRSEQSKIWRDRHIFRMRAYGLGLVTAKELALLWRSQRGLCALTGRKLNRTSEVDHRVPKSRGGLDHISNLQWVVAEANQSKWDFSESDFVSLCADVVRIATMKDAL